MRRLLCHRMPALNNISRLPWIKGNQRKFELGNPPGPSFSPADLFANGEEGVWFDPSDLSTMFQDSAGTTPVTADGQPVGLILDKSGNGNHASQATAAKRPLHKTDGTYHWLQFDGVDDSLSTAEINFTATDKMSVFAGVRKNDDSTGFIAELSASSETNAGSFGYMSRINGAVAQSSYEFTMRGSSGAAVSSPYPFGIGVNVVDTRSLNIAGASSTDEVVARINGATPVNDWKTGTAGTGNFGNYPLYIGLRAGASYPFNGRIYSLIIQGRTATAAEITATETWINSKTGAY